MVSSVYPGLLASAGLDAERGPEHPLLRHGVQGEVGCRSA